MNFKNISIVLKLFEIFEVNAYCNNVRKFIVNICIIIICQNLHISYNIKLFKFLKLYKIINFRKKIKEKMIMRKIISKLLKFIIMIFLILINTILIKNYLLLKILMFCPSNI